jgi:hypothetical protein
MKQIYYLCRRRGKIYIIENGEEIKVDPRNADYTNMIIKPCKKPCRILNGDILVQ